MSCTLDFKIPTEERKKVISFALMNLLQKLNSKSFDFDFFLKDFYKAFINKNIEPAVAATYLRMLPGAIIAQYTKQESFRKTVQNAIDNGNFDLSYIAKLDSIFNKNGEGLENIAEYLKEDPDLINQISLQNFRESIEREKVRRYNESVKKLEIPAFAAQQETLEVNMTGVLSKPTFEEGMDTDSILFNEELVKDLNLIPYSAISFMSDSLTSQGLFPYTYPVTEKNGKVVNKTTANKYYYISIEKGVPIKGTSNDQYLLHSGKRKPGQFLTTNDPETDGIKNIPMIPTIPNPNYLAENAYRKLHDKVVRNLLGNLYHDNYSVIGFERGIKVSLRKNEDGKPYFTFLTKDDELLKFNNEGKIDKEGTITLSYPFNNKIAGTDVKFLVTKKNGLDVVKQDSDGRVAFYSDKLKDVYYSVIEKKTSKEGEDLNDYIKSQVLELYEISKLIETQDEILFEPIGGSFGFTLRKIKREEYANLKDVNFEYNEKEDLPRFFIKTSQQDRGVIYMNHPSLSNVPVTVERPIVSKKYSSKIIRLLTSPVYKKTLYRGQMTSRNLDPKSIRDHIDTMIYLNAGDLNVEAIENKEGNYDKLVVTFEFKIFNVLFDKNNNITKITLGNKTISTSEFEAYLNQYFDNTHPSLNSGELSSTQERAFRDSGAYYDPKTDKYFGKDKSGNYKEISRQSLRENFPITKGKGSKEFYIMEHAKLHFKASLDVFDDFEITEAGELVSNRISYNRYVVENFQTPYDLGPDKRIKMVEPYITLKRVAEEVKPQVADVKTEVKPQGSKKIDLGSELNEEDASALFKNKVQKTLEEKLGKNLSEYEKRAETWFKNHPAAAKTSLWKMNDLRGIMNSSGVAKFTHAGITLYMGSDMTDLYHESWHTFTQLLLTSQQKDKLYKEARSLPGEFKSFNGNYVSFKNATEKELEEYLAEDFRTYMLTGKGEFVKAPVKKTLFQRIKELLIDLFNHLTTADLTGGDETNPYLYEMYEALSTGKGPLFEQPFSVSNMRFSSLNYDGPTSYNQDKSKNPEAILSPTSSLEVMSTLDYLMSNFILNLNSVFRANTGTGTVKLRLKNADGKSYEETFSAAQVRNGLLKYYSRKNLGLSVDPDLQSLAEAFVMTANNTPLPLINKEQFTGNSYTSFSKIFNNPALLKLAYKNIAESLNDIILTKQVQHEKETDETLKSILSNQIEELLQVLDNFGNTDDILRNLSPKRGGIIHYHLTKSPLIPLVIKENLKTQYKENIQTQIKEDNVLVEDLSDEEFESFVRTEEGNSDYADRRGNDKDTTEMAFEEIQYLLSTLLDKNPDGSVNNNRYGLPKLLPFNIAWNKTITALENKLSFEDMYQKMEEEARKDSSKETIGKKYMIFEQIITRLGKPNTLNKEHFLFLSKFWQSFNKAYIPLLQVNFDKSFTQEEGDNLPTFQGWKITSGQSFGQTSKIDALWRNDFQNTPSSEYITQKKINDNTYESNIINLSAIIKNFPTVKAIKENPIEFFHALGVYLSDDVLIKEFITKGNNNLGLKSTDLYEILERVKILNTENIIVQNPSDFWNKTYSHLEGSSTALATKTGLYKNYLILQANYGEDYTSFMVKNAEGETQFEHSLNNTLTIITNTINSVKSYQELIEKPWMKHFDTTVNPNIKYSLWFRSIFEYNELDETFGKKRTSSFESVNTIKLELKNLSGTSLLKNRVFENGIALASADPTTKRLSDITLAVQLGIFELPRHADKSTSYSTYVSEIISSKNSAPLSLSNVIDEYKKNNQGDSYSEIMIDYLSAELERIARLSQINKTNTSEFDWNYKTRGSELLMFKDILTNTEANNNLKKSLEEIMNSELSLSEKLEFIKNLRKNKDFINDIIFDIKNYHTAKAKNYYEKLQKLNKYFTSESGNPLMKDVLKEIKGVEKLEDKLKIISIYMTSNSFINNAEAYTMFYGDAASFVHKKEEANKRNAGAGSTGNIYRTDNGAIAFLNANLRNKSGIPNSPATYAEKINAEKLTFDGTMHTAVLQDVTVKSVYETELTKILGDKADKYIENSEKATDAQGLITFDTYRELKYLEGTWSNHQEDLYNKILRGENVDTKDVIEFFPVIKAQYYGPLMNTPIAITGFHKYSLMPLIPSVLKHNDILTKFHDKLTRENIGYATFSSGSKVGTITRNSGQDKLLTEDNALDDEFNYTRNTIHLNYLKNQLDITPKFKNKVIFSTQLRKLIIEGLMANGVPTDFKPEITDPNERITLWNRSSKNESENYKIVKEYEANVKALTELKEKEILEQIKWKRNAKGKLEGNLKDLINFVQQELSRQEIAEHELDFIKVNENNNKVQRDFSLTPHSEKIEKIITSLVTKKIITQKVNGEGLIQVSSVGWQENGFKKADEKDRLKYGTNGLRFYHPGKDKKTVSMQVKIAIQGDFIKLLELPLVKETAEKEKITTLQALNSLIKNEEWLNEGNNRKLITMAAVRIPVQGLNSMEFMEVAEFLPKEAGNIIIPPIEIVVKSGSDFDVDKLNVIMPAIDNINGDIVYAKGNTTRGIENKLIENITTILSKESNYKMLVKPNDTDLVKPVADELGLKSDKYNSLDNVTGERNKVISETRIFEYEYNLYKHTSNSVGKQSLGLGAVDNTFNTLFNRIGLYMNPIQNKIPQRLLLPHNKLKIGDEIAISLSHLTDADNKNSIADVISQLINGWVDVAKDAWVFNVQGNKEASPKLLFLVQAGVPFKTAVYFLTQPEIVKYIEMKIENESLVADKDFNIQKTFIKNSGLNISEDDLKVILKDPYKAISKLKLKLTEKEFETNLEKVINKEEVDPEFKILTLLHYFEVEKMADGVRDIKLNYNPDTKRPATLFDSLMKNADIEKVRENPVVPIEKLDELAKETVISGFFIKDYLEELMKDLFKLRNHNIINEVLYDTLQSKKESLSLKSVSSDISQAIRMFKNHFLSYIFQKQLLEFDYKNASFFKGVNIETSDVKKLDLLTFGAHAVKENDKYKLYIDPVQIEVNFQNLTSIVIKSKEILKEVDVHRYRAPVKKAFFKNDKVYAKFIAQRELFRAMYPMNILYENKVPTLERLYTKLLPNISKYENEKVFKTVVYEEWLKNKALEKTYNIDYLFKGDNTYADRFKELKNKYPQLINQFKLIELLDISENSNKANKIKNLIIKNVKLDKQILKVLNTELEQLKDRNTVKLEDSFANKEVTEFFQDFETVALLQSGFSTGGIFSLSRIVSPNSYLNVIGQTVNQYERKLTREIINNYFKNFINHFQKSNSSRDRYVDLLSKDNTEFVELYDVKPEFKGKIIYVTPGAGKTFISQLNPFSIKDADNETLKVIQEMFPEFTVSKGEPIQKTLERFAKDDKYKHHKDDMRAVVRERLRNYADKGFLVLTGSRYHMSVADEFYTLTRTDENISRLLTRFKTNETLSKFSIKELEDVNDVLEERRLPLIESLPLIDSTRFFLSEESSPISTFTNTLNQLSEKVFTYSPDSLKIVEETVGANNKIQRKIKDVTENVLESSPNKLFIVNDFESPLKSKSTFSDNVLLNSNSPYIVGLTVSDLTESKLFPKNELYKDIDTEKGKEVNPAFKNYVDNFIEELKENQEKYGYDLVFNDEGYGQNLLNNKKDLENSLGYKNFKYLSEKLYDNFGYINPNFVRLADNSFVPGKAGKEAREFISSKQKVSDQDVINKFKECFKSL